jgi:hypothetical protein
MTDLSAYSAAKDRVSLLGEAEGRGRGIKVMGEDGKIAKRAFKLPCVKKTQA